MNDITPTPQSPYSATLPFLQLAWDSTSLGELKRCPQRYKYTIIDGYTTGEPSDDLIFGIIFHSATELYEHRKSQGLEHDLCVIDAVRHCIVQSWDFENNRPLLTGDEPNKTRETLIRTVIWYLDNYKDENIKTHILQNGRAAVEVSFRLNLEADDGDEGRFRTMTTDEPFLLCGHLDKIAEWNDQLWIMDKKTTKYELDSYYFRQYYPDNQMSLYDIAGAIIMDRPIEGVIVDAAQVLVGGSRFRRELIHRDEHQRNDWLKDLTMWLHMAEIFATANHWPQNEKGCGFGKMTCVFRGVCSSDPRMRQQLLDSNFVKREFWNPLKPR